MSHTIYSNFVLENKLDSLLATNIDMNSYITADYSLTESPGMIKKIHTYTATGQLDEVAMGEGNTHEYTVSFSEVPYTVGTTQGRFAYFDEEEMTDPIVVDRGLKAISEGMVNDLTTKAIAELNKATLTHETAAWDFDGIVDAIAKYPYEDEAGLTLLISPALKAEFRKNLQDDLKYVEANARTGYIGSICGVPVVVSKAVPAGTAFLFTKQAITCFVKKGVEVEPDRDPNIRKNTVYARKVMLVALTDATRVIKITKAVAQQGQE